MACEERLTLMKITHTNSYEPSMRWSCCIYILGKFVSSQNGFGSSGRKMVQFSVACPVHIHHKDADRQPTKAGPNSEAPSGVELIPSDQNGSKRGMICNQNQNISKSTRTCQSWCEHVMRSNMRWRETYHGTSIGAMWCVKHGKKHVILLMGEMIMQYNARVDK